MQYTASNCPGVSPQKSHRYSVSGMTAIKPQTTSYHARNEPLSHDHRNLIKFPMQCTFNVHGGIDVIPLPYLSFKDVPYMFNLRNVVSFHWSFVKTASFQCRLVNPTICCAAILEKIVQFQNQKSRKMILLGLQMKHVILKICNILTSYTKFYPHHLILFELQAVEYSS